MSSAGDDSTKTSIDYCDLNGTREEQTAGLRRFVEEVGAVALQNDEQIYGQNMTVNCAAKLKIGGEIRLIFGFHSKKSSTGLFEDGTLYLKYVRFTESANDKRPITIPDNNIGLNQFRANINTLHSFTSWEKVFLVDFDYCARKLFSAIDKKRAPENSVYIMTNYKNKVVELQFVGAVHRTRKLVTCISTWLQKYDEEVKKKYQMPKRMKQNTPKTSVASNARTRNIKTIHRKSPKSKQSQIVFSNESSQPMQSAETDRSLDALGANSDGTVSDYDQMGRTLFPVDDDIVMKGLGTESFGSDDVSNSTGAKGSGRRRSASATEVPFGGAKTDETTTEEPIKGLSEDERDVFDIEMNAFKMESDRALRKIRRDFRSSGMPYLPDIGDSQHSERRSIPTIASLLDNSTTILPYRLSKDAMWTLQYMTENILVDLFERAYRIAENSNRNYVYDGGEWTVKISLDDFQLARVLSDNPWDPKCERWANTYVPDYDSYMRT